MVPKDVMVFRRAVLPLALIQLLAGLPAAVGAQAGREGRTPRDPGLVVGLVVDRESGEPLEGVAITVRTTVDDPNPPAVPGPVLTDDSGRFMIRGLVDGRYSIAVERIGYQDVASSLVYRSDLGVRIDVEMVQEAVELEPLLVVAQGGSHYLENAGFYDRTRRGIGRFVTRDEILARNLFQMSDVFTGMAGVRVTRGGRPGSEGVVLLRGGCMADVYVDGLRLLPPVSVDNLVQPLDVEAVEVYSGPEIPAAYRTTSCGAVLIWTRVPNPGVPGSPLTWRRVLVVAGFAAFAFVITR